jgi:hypothetical protein
MHMTEADLTPQDRLRELAGIFASGILRLRTCRGTAASPPTDATEESSEIPPESPLLCPTGRH